MFYPCHSCCLIFMQSWRREASHSNSTYFGQIRTQFEPDKKSFLLVLVSWLNVFCTSPLTQYLFLKSSSSGALLLCFLVFAYFCLILPVLCSIQLCFLWCFNCYTTQFGSANNASLQVFTFDKYSPIFLLVLSLLRC